MEQAEQMIKKNRVEGRPCQKGVAIAIPPVDRGTGEPRNIVGVIHDKSQHETYPTAWRSDVFKGSYTRNEFEFYQRGSCRNRTSGVINR